MCIPPSRISRQREEHRPGARAEQCQAQTRRELLIAAQREGIAHFSNDAKGGLSHSGGHSKGDITFVIAVPDFANMLAQISLVL